MVGKQEIYRILGGYDKEKLSIATVCSHSSLQIFDGARKEGFKTIGISVGKPKKLYDAFPLGKPDEFLIVDSYKDLLSKDITSKLIEKNAILIPHGSFVEYLGAEKFLGIQVPTYGNRDVLNWESDREISREWLESAGIKMPKKIHDPKDIVAPTIVKYYGAKGGKNFFVAKDYADFKNKLEKQIDNGNHNEKYTMQEFVLGTRYYLQYFYSPIKDDGYRLSKGSLEFLGIDKRIESNADELFRVGSPTELLESGIHPTFVVTGNQPLVIRESLLEEVMNMGERVVEKSIGLFGGMIGPFCLESVITDGSEIKVFEISARIVAGSNLYISGSPYSDLIEPDLSTGKRIAQEIKRANEQDLLEEIIS